MQKRLWQIHSWLGLIAGLALLLIGLSGSVLVFREEIEATFYPQHSVVEPTKFGRLPIDDLVEIVHGHLPQYGITGWERSDDPRRADSFFVKPLGGTKYQIAMVNPYNGEVLASPISPRQTLIGWMLELHYSFFADHTGLFIAGLFATMLCLLGVTGVWLYRGFWKNFFTLRWGRSARIFFSDAHKMIGISSVAFNLLLGFTGAYWNLTHVIGHWVEGHTDEEIVMTQQPVIQGYSLASLIDLATQKMPGFHTGYISLATTPTEDVTLWGHIAPRGLFTGPYGCNAFFDAKTGAIKSFADIRQGNLWTRFVDTFTPLHFGTFGGLPVKILWGLGGLTPGLLAVLGFLIWRTRQRTTPSAAKPQPQPELQPR